MAIPSILECNQVVDFQNASGNTGCSTGFLLACGRGHRAVTLPLTLLVMRSAKGRQAAGTVDDVNANESPNGGILSYMLRTGNLIRIAGASERSDATI
jgi:hypothetical protein